MFRYHINLLAKRYRGVSKGLGLFTNGFRSTVWTAALGTDFLNMQHGSNFSSEESTSARVLPVELNQSKLIYNPPTDSG